MYNKIECVTITCDNCGKEFVEESTDFSIFPDESYADMSAQDSDWHSNNGLHYCDECYMIDDDDNLTIKTNPHGQD